MKKLIYAIVLFVFFLISCGKEKGIVPALKLDNIYEIKNDGDDSINQRIYNIYQKYKVPVFFNDTIGQVFVGKDAKGQPIYQTEKIDLSWSFSSYTKQNYQFDYLSTDKEKSTALNIVEEYLKIASPSLRPFSFFITRSGKKMDSDKLVQEYKNGAYLLGFRTIFMTGNWTAAQITVQPKNMKKDIVVDKILNYSDDVTDFSVVSKSAWYGGLFWYLIEPSVVYGWNSAQALYDDWTGAKWYTAPQLDSMRNEARGIIGKYGFIKGNVTAKGLQTPQNPTDDLKDFVVEILKYSPQTFKSLWGKHPLVMKKYGILSNVIVNKMQVDL